MYKQAVIYFMTGTGNSFRTSSWIKDIALEKNTNALAIPIERGNPEKEIEDKNDTLMGIVMPTHGFTAPWHMIRFVYRLPFRKSTHAFCIATRAGLKFGRVFTPGISGSGTFVIAAVLALKGYKVRGIMSLDMPSNWIAFHSGLHPKKVESIIHRAKPKVSRFIERLYSNRKNWFTPNNLYEIVWGIALLPIALLYLLIGRFFLAKLFFPNSRCNGCGICADNCAVGAIKMSNGKNPRPFWKYNCENCMRCMAFCPQEAIEAGHSWAVILYFITSVPVSVYLFAWIDAGIPVIGALNNAWLRRAIDILYLYPSLFISYYIFSKLLKIPIVNSLFTYTTLTHIYRRYKEPGTTLKDIGTK